MRGMPQSGMHLHLSIQGRVQVSMRWLRETILFCNWSLLTLTSRQRFAVYWCCHQSLGFKHAQKRQRRQPDFASQFAEPLIQDCF